MAKKKMEPANDAGVPECEMVLAMALQNAGARGWKAIKGDFYDKTVRLDWANKPKPADGASACCFRGALLLEPDSESFDDSYVLGADGNNADDVQSEPMYSDDDSWRTGAAFEIALRNG